MNNRTLTTFGGTFAKLFFTEVINLSSYYDYDQFNVEWEDHYVLIREIEQADSDIYIHSVVVDHSGHAFPCNTEEFTPSIEIIDQHIKRIVEWLGENTLFILHSDHGMSCNKYESHGGPIPEHRAAFFYAYSTTKPFVNEQVVNEISSADLAATMSTLINVNPPYMNLGIYE